MAKEEKFLNQNGWAMEQMLIAIVIGLIMLAGVFALVKNTMDNSKVQTAQSNIAAIRLAVKQLFSGQPDYTGLSNTVLQNAGGFPSTMLKSGGIKNAWNGDVVVAVDGADPTRFTISYSSVPKEACLKLAVFGFGQWLAVTVNGANIPQTGSGAVAAASGACGDTNTIVYTSN